MPKKKKAPPPAEEEHDRMDNPLANANAGRREFDIMDQLPEVETPRDGNGTAGDPDDDSVLAALEARVERLQLELETKVEKLQRMAGMKDMSQTDKLLEYEKLVQAKDAELEAIRRELFIDAKAHPNKKQRAKIAKVMASLAEKDTLHQSPNTVQTVMDLERRTADVDGDPDHPVQFVWAFVYDIPDAETIDGMTSPERLEQAESDGVASPRSAQSGVHISHEAWMACEKIITADLCLRHAIPIDGKQLIIAVGATHAVLVDEAQQMKLLMRMQETKGTMEFHQDLLRYYATNHGGLNEYVQGPRMIGDPRAADTQTPDPNYPSDLYHRGPHLAPRDPEQLEQHWKYDEDLTDEELAKRKKNYYKVFTSALAQRLVMNRLRRLGRYDPDHAMQLAGGAGKGGKGGKGPDIRVLEQVCNRSVVRHRDISASMLHDLLTLYGGYRPQNQAVFPLARGEAVVAHVAKQVQADDQFILKTTGLDTHKKLQAGAGDALTYDHVVDCVAVFERWRQGAGRQEIWFGTLASYFPLHMESELLYLKREWGNPKVLLRRKVIGYNPEGEPREVDSPDGEDGTILEFNTFGAAKNTRSEHSFPVSLWYQPIEEIRDYFGDDVGLYFSWLGTYTQALLLQSTLGMVVMIYQPIAGAKNPECDFFGCGVAYNPLTIFYSVYVGIWSTIFIESWHRRENELRFLWGTEKLSQIEQPRPSFEGELDTNPETGRQLIVVKSQTVQYLKVIASTLVSVAFILFTIASAVAAQMVRYVDPGDVEGLLEKKKYELLSAALNLTIIGVYGAVFEALADYLTEWENHRTQSEYDNARVGKNFLFQFVNNYFVLFYIAYLREVEDPISKAAHPCLHGNCLPELQIQLIVVFSGKTIGKQLSYTMKPFIFKWKASCKANKMTKKIVKASSKGTSLMPAAMQHAMEQVTTVAGAAAGNATSDPRNHLKALKSVRNPYELQNRLMPYDGTFDDFNDRVIQFGYLVLFAPAFPLAPFLAFVNNVVEIRTSGFKMCFAYQRPKWRARSGIGSWLAVMNVLGFLAVITNASMITFVGDQDARSRQLCLNATLDGVNIPKGSPLLGITAEEPEGVCPEGAECSYGCGGFNERTQQWVLWLQFVITEHAVLMLRVVILSVSPSMPKWIGDVREVLEYRMANRYLTAEHLEAERRQFEEYNAKMNDSVYAMKRQLRNKTQSELQVLFDEQDQVRALALQPVSFSLVLCWRLAVRVR